MTGCLKESDVAAIHPRSFFYITPSTYPPGRQFKLSGNLLTAPG